MIAVGVFFLLGALGIVFLSKAIIGPIKTLVKGLQSISKQHPQRLIEYHKTNEFGRLAEAFNNMAVRLQHEEQMRTDFIATLSHEIRSPLTSILESVNLIEEGLIGTVNEQQRKFLKIASSEIDRVVDLLNHLLQVVCIRTTDGNNIDFLQGLDSQCYLTNKPGGALSSIYKV